MLVSGTAVEAAAEGASVVSWPVVAAIAIGAIAIVDEVWAGEAAAFEARVHALERDHGPDARALVALDADHEVIGVALFTPSRISGSLHELSWLAVAPTRRLRGVGRAIVTAAVAAARTLRSGLVSATETPAFYERCGCGNPVRFTEDRWLFVISGSAEVGASR
jgi:GNAT superfamily N-acetyltransferase